jgi:hypothetical protein
VVCVGVGKCVYVWCTCVCVCVCVCVWWLLYVCVRVVCGVHNYVVYEY